MTYYIDPGTTKGCAVARSRAGALIGLAIVHGYLRTPGKFWGVRRGNYEPAEPAFWEKPQFYPNELRKLSPQALVARANALIDLAACGADTARGLAGMGQVTSVSPREWKGQVPKPIHHGRVLLRLTQPELDLVRSAYSGTTAAKPRALDDYVARAAVRVAKKDPGGYTSEITDLLDAVALMLTCEGRL